MRNRRISQQKIADAVGVSQPVVSAFLNNPNTSSISPEKKERIFRYIRENDNFNFSKKTRACIGFVMPSMAEKNTWEYIHDFYTGVLDRCEQLGKKVLMYNDISDMDVFLNHSQLEVNGLLVLKKVDREQVLKMLGYHPLVLMNQEIEDIICDVVITDNKGGMNLIVSHLAEMGHRKIAFFGLVSRGNDYYKNIHFHKRYEGYREAARKHNLSVKPEHVKIFEAFKNANAEVDEFALKALNDWKDDMPTAVVGANDRYALSIIKAVQKLGYRIPHDLSVTGFDNKLVCEQVYPEVTTVAFHMKDIAEASVDMLIKRLEGDKSKPKKLICSVDFVRRNSVLDLAEKNNRKGGENGNNSSAEDHREESLAGQAVCKG